ncbi:hypothetical protein [Arthrobacter sp. NicSoilC12]|uniref:hypothetical protein n=1 Tax=Arthrobacter sp. NicSoilC12 TaxID=2831001 RepID=UPI001CC34941|nr:hypothetical protein [Arthrobacter sp. NicSoilC12]
MDSLIEEVSLTVLTFLAQPTFMGKSLSEASSRKIQALAKTRPYQTDKELRSRLAFWESLDKVYGFEGCRSGERTASLLDIWQDWIRCSHYPTESSLLDMTQWWLEEFDQSDMGWRPPRGRRESNFFAADRIRDAARQFLKMHQGQHPDIIRVSDIRPARLPRTETLIPDKPQRRTTSQPVHVPVAGAHFGGDRVSIPGLKGNIEDYWLIPK